MDDLEIRGDSGVMKEEDSFGLMRQDMSRQLGFYLSAGRKQVCLRLKGLWAGGTKTEKAKAPVSLSGDIEVSFVVI